MLEGLMSGVVQAERGRGLYNAILQSCCLIQPILSRGLHQAEVLCVVPKNLKGKSKSSQQWISRQLNDPYVARAKKLGYRARSAFKLIEIDEKFRLLKPGQIIIDCGAAPGAWTQVAVQRINSDGKRILFDDDEYVGKSVPKGRIVSVDLLDIEPVEGAITLPHYDFTQEFTRELILRLLRNDPESESCSPAFHEPADGIKERIFDGILSDMAPNATGVTNTDHYRIISLVNVAKEFAVQHAKKGSFFVAKVWNGAETNSLVKTLEELYKFVKITKPNASRENSGELFVVAKKKLA